MSNITNSNMGVAFDELDESIQYIAFEKWGEALEGDESWSVDTIAEFVAKCATKGIAVDASGIEYDVTSGVDYACFGGHVMDIDKLLAECHPSYRQRADMYPSYDVLVRDWYLCGYMSVSTYAKHDPNHIPEQAVAVVLHQSPYADNGIAMPSYQAQVDDARAWAYLALETIAQELSEQLCYQLADAYAKISTMAYMRQMANENSWRYDARTGERI